MSREVHVRIWEGVGVRFPHATRLWQPVKLRSGLIGYLGAPPVWAAWVENPYDKLPATFAYQKWSFGPCNSELTYSKIT